MARRRKRLTGNRPKPFALDEIKCRVVRGPHRDDPNRWYWQAVTYNDKQKNTVWTGWGTVAEVRAAVAPLLMGLEVAPANRDDRVNTVQDLLEVWLAWQLRVGRTRGLRLECRLT